MALGPGIGARRCHNRRLRGYQRLSWLAAVTSLLRDVEVASQRSREACCATHQSILLYWHVEVLIYSK